MQESDEGFPNWCKIVELEIVNLINLFNPHKVTIACDGKSLWRKKISPEYKANRAKARLDFPIDWDKFFAVRDEYLHKFSTMYPCKTIYLDTIEADDIIAILVKDLHETEEVIAITGDADIHQLFRFSNFRCYDAKNHKEVKDIDWEDLLTVKVLSGDKGDNIKAIKPRLGPVSARKIMFESDGDIHKYCVENGLEKEYLLNQQLVNFEMIPEYIQELIRDAYENVKIITPDLNDLAMNSNLDYVEIMDLFNRNLFKKVNYLG